METYDVKVARAAPLSQLFVECCVVVRTQGNQWNQLTRVRNAETKHFSVVALKYQVVPSEIMIDRFIVPE